jgi:hypothetical protein
MTGFAFDHGVRAQQRKTVLVVLNRLNRDRPAFLGVTLLATPAELPAMNICVTRLAGGPDVAENRADVTLRAIDARMHSAQGKAGAVVIEFRNAADRLPTRKRVAIVARHGQRAMGTY